MQELDSYLSLGQERTVRIRCRESKSECSLCGAECESVVHVLWESIPFASNLL